MAKHKLYLPIIFLFLFYTLPVFAASPDAGTILREFKEAPKPITPEIKPFQKKIESPTIDDKNGTKIKITGFDFEGQTIFSSSELFEELIDLIDKEFTMTQLDIAPRRIIAFYAKHGRIVSAFFPQQEVKAGRLRIKIIEGKLGNITIDQNSKSRFHSDLALKYMLKNNILGEAINKDKLETAVRLLKGLPGVSATTTLLPGNELGTSDLILKLEDTAFINGTLEADNHGSLSSGEYRGAVTFNLNNPFGYGDQVVFKAQTSLESNFGRLAYNIPIGLNGARLSLSSSFLHYDLGGELKSKGDALTVGKSLSYPIINNQIWNLSGQLSYDFKWLYNEARTIAVNNKLIHSGNIGFNADINDHFFGGGYNNLSIGFILGDLDLSTTKSDEEQDQAGPKKSGFYSKMTFSASRTQTIIENKTSISISINGQYAFKNLDSSDQFSLGGLYGVRGYASSEGGGDTGFVISTELRQVILPSLQTSLFYDFGWIMQHTNQWSGWNNNSSIPNEYTLDGIGVSINWNPVNWLSFKGVIANRIGNNPSSNIDGKDSDGTKREPRFWIQSIIYF